MKLLLTFDVEDWFQVENFRENFPMKDWSSLECRFQESTRKILKLLNDSGRKATFFILGWNAERAPELVREIELAGHEIASHGYDHVLCHQLSKETLAADLRRAKGLLEDMIGKEIAGYRAPSFSITNEVFGVIKEEGYRYDSSYNSFGLNHRYGKLDLGDGFMKNGIGYVDRDGFIELPVSNLSWGGQTLPWAGGGYFRMWPSRIFLNGVRRILERTGVYLFYLHPWEVDSGQPRVKDAPFFFKARHYLNLEKTAERLAEFIGMSEGIQYMTCSEYLNSLDSV